MNAAISISMLAGSLVLGCAHRQSELDECRQRLVDANRQAGELGQAMEDEMTVRELAERRRDAYQDVVSLLDMALEDMDYEIAVIHGRLVVQLPNSILFDFGKAELKPEGKEALDKVADVLRQTPKRNFLLAGHTDNIPVGKKNPKFKSNWELSMRRSLAVMEYLVTSGIDPALLGAAGYGEHHPVSDNGTEEGRARNRRTEIIVMPTLNEIPKMEPIAEPTKE